MSAEITPAVQRAAVAIKETVCTAWPAYVSERMAARIARDGLAAALDIEEMARAADPQAFEDMDPTSNRSIALGYVARRRSATEHAERIRTALLGADS